MAVAKFTSSPALPKRRNGASSPPSSSSPPKSASLSSPKPASGPISPQFTQPAGRSPPSSRSSSSSESSTPPPSSSTGLKSSTRGSPICDLKLLFETPPSSSSPKHGSPICDLKLLFETPPSSPSPKHAAAISPDLKESASGSSYQDSIPSSSRIKDPLPRSSTKSKSKRNPKMKKSETPESSTRQEPTKSKSKRNPKMKKSETPESSTRQEYAKPRSSSEKEPVTFDEITNPARIVPKSVDRTGFVTKATKTMLSEKKVLMRRARLARVGYADMYPGSSL